MDYFAFFLRVKSAKTCFFVVIGVASRSGNAVTPRDEENVAAIGAIFLGHFKRNVETFWGVFSGRQAQGRRQNNPLWQEEKDREFKAALALIAAKSAKESHGLDETKKSLQTWSATKRTEKQLRMDRQREIYRDTSSESFQERLVSTFHNLELNSTAHELDEWCHECGCLHTSFVVNDDDADQH